MLQILGLPLAAGGHLSVLSGVVKGEGDLGADVHIIGGDAGHQGLGIEVGGLQDAADVVLGELGVRRGVGKGGVGSVQTGVQHGDGHALTGKPTAGQGHLQSLGISLLGGGQRVGPGHKGTGDTLGVPDGFQILPGCADGEAVEQGGIGIAVFHLLLAQGAGQAGLHRGLAGQQTVLHPGHRLGRGGAVQLNGHGSVLQLHQDIHDLVGILLGRGHLLAGLSGLADQLLRRGNRLHAQPVVRRRGRRDAQTGQQHCHRHAQRQKSSFHLRTSFLL